eukprot:4095-Amphidinium_carterae.1
MWTGHQADPQNVEVLLEFYTESKGRVLQESIRSKSKDLPTLLDCNEHWVITPGERHEHEEEEQPSGHADGGDRG